MKTYFITILATATANILTFLVYQGFVKSYYGKNCMQEVSRGFNNLRLYIQYYITKKRKCSICDKIFEPKYKKQEYCKSCINIYYGSSSAYSYKK